MAYWILKKPHLSSGESTEVLFLREQQPQMTERTDLNILQMLSSGDVQAGLVWKHSEEVGDDNW